jgi:hypothetical protein
MSETPLFQQRAEASIAKCKELYTRRGDQYGDTWRDCNWLKLRAILFTMFGMKPSITQCRAMGLAAFADMKYWRHLGGYAEDHQLDGINYDAALASEMREIYAEAGNTETLDEKMQRIFKHDNANTGNVKSTI